MDLFMTPRHGEASAPSAMIELWHEWNSVSLSRCALSWPKKYRLDGAARRAAQVRASATLNIYLNPNGVVPTLVHEARSCLIVGDLPIPRRGVSRAPPHARNPYPRAQARMWLKAFDEVVHPAIRQASFELLYRPLLELMPPASSRRGSAGHPNPARAQRFRDAARALSTSRRSSKRCWSLQYDRPDGSRARTGRMACGGELQLGRRRHGAFHRTT